MLVAGAWHRMRYVALERRATAGVLSLPRLFDPSDVMTARTSNTALLDQIVARLVRVLEPERVYLFGSRARGDMGSDSDFDLLIVVSTSELPGYARDRIALRALRGLKVPADVIVLTREEFESRRGVVCSLPATVDREGKLLYAA